MMYVLLLSLTVLFVVRFRRVFVYLCYVLVSAVAQTWFVPVLSSAASLVVANTISLRRSRARRVQEPLQLK